MAYLGQMVTVKLTETVAAAYNAQNQALDDVAVDTERPAMVVGVNAAHQSPDPSQKNIDGSPVMHDVPETVNLAVYHDGALAPYYVQHVPSDVLTEVGLNATAKPSAKEEDADAKEGRSWDPNREGTGEPYQGPGPSAPDLTSPSQNAPAAPGTVVPGEGPSQSSGQTPPSQWV
jgi:hypothetical protein